MSEPTLNQLQAANEQLRLDRAELRRQLEDAEGTLAALRERGEQTARQAERRQDAFLSKLVHDLRNPLAPIHNALEIMKLPNGGDADKQRALEIIDGQVRNLRRLLTDVLDLSRIICEKIDLKKQPVALADVVGRAVECNDALMVRHKHQLVVALPADPVWLMGDAARLVQAIANLLENAAKYTPEGGQIRVAAVSEGDEVVCRIIDNGSGIDAKKLPRIFDLFAHAERTLDEIRPGLGVGLTVVRKLVVLHGGRVEAWSDGPGRGSEFVVRLPRLADPEIPKAAPSEPAAGQGNLPARRILLVSDQDFAEELGMLLRLAGHETRTAHNALEALEAAKQFQPQVIMLELDLPRLDADDLGRRLRTLPGLEKALLIAIAGTANEKNRQRATAASCQAHLAKPVKIRDLLRLIAEKDALAGSGP